MPKPKTKEEIFLKIVDLVVNASGIVDLATAEKLFSDYIQSQRTQILGEIEKWAENQKKIIGKSQWGSGYLEALEDITQTFKKRKDK